MPQNANLPRRIGHEELRETRTHVYDSAGNRIGYVRGVQEIPGGLRVWILARSPDGQHAAGISGDDVAEFVADLERAYLRADDAL